MKKKAIAVLALIGITVTASLFYFAGRRYEVVITQGQIDAALAQRFPVSKHHLIFLRITYSDPIVTLLPDANRVRVGMKAELGYRQDEQDELIGGTVSVVTGIRYDPEKHQFFLQDPQIDEIRVQGVPSKLADRVANGFLAVSKEHLESFPVYTIRAEDVKKSIARMLLKNFQVRDGAIHLTLGI